MSEWKLNTGRNVHEEITVWTAEYWIKMRNKYTGPCTDCGNIVRSCNGYFERRAGRFVVRCIKCVAWGKVVKGKPLSDAQKETLEEGRT